MFFEWLKRLIKFRFKSKREEKVSDINISAKNLIDYYCAMKVAPEYALLVKGPWGCGKSHLVKDCIKDLEKANKEFKFLYVSLYGINDISDIEAKFFEQLNPILSNKKVMFAGQIAKGVLKGALKIDLDGDGKADATASVAVPDINLADYLTDTRNCILVFDDLERCELNLQVILGYMNYFIEKDGYKVVIVADEDKLIAQKDAEDDKYPYTDIKEKLIGKTVQVEPDVSSVFDNFVNELFPADNAKDLIIHNEVKDILNLNKEKIIQIFQQSKHENLRSLRKCFLDLKQWIEIFDNEIRKNNELLEHFFSLFVAISMELHSGKIKPEELGKLIGLTFLIQESVKSAKGKEKSELKLATEKYDLDFADVLINPIDWVNFFAKGCIDSESIISALKSTKYFLHDDTPDWKKLWYLIDLEDEEFLSLQRSVQESFDNREYVDLGELKHVSGMFLDHISQGLSSKTSKGIVKDVENYLSDLNKSGNAKIYENIIRDLNGYSSYANLGYTSANTDEFKEITTLINKFIEKSATEDLILSSSKLLQQMRVDPISVTKLFDGSSRDESIYYDKPILQYISPSDFISAFIDMPNIDKRHFSNVLVKRYESVYREDEIFVEMDWLEKLIKEIHQYLQLSTPSVSQVIMTFTHKNLLEVFNDVKFRTKVDEDNAESQE
jgi:Cdc6-like AAA superfamily ATPase